MSQASSYSPAEIVDRTRTWVRENFLYMRPDWKFGDDDPLLGSGVIDSIGVIELVEFLQGAFPFKIADEEIVEQNLGTRGGGGCPAPPPRLRLVYFVPSLAAAVVSPSRCCWYQLIM